MHAVALPQPPQRAGDSLRYWYASVDIHVAKIGTQWNTIVKDNMRYAAKVDDNQTEIIKALEKIGVSVEVIGKPVDLMICHRGETSVMEVKNREGRNQLTKDQVEFIARWPGQVHVVHTPEEAIEAVLGKEMLK